MGWTSFPSLSPPSLLSPPSSFLLPPSGVHTLTIEINVHISTDRWQVLCSEVLYMYVIFHVYLQVILGKKVVRPCVFDQCLVESILSCQNDTSFQTVLGGTMCTDDFYEGRVECTCVCTPSICFLYA